MKLNLKGDVVNNDLAFMYDYFEMDYIAPSNIADAIENVDDGVLDISISSYGGDVVAASEIYSALKDFTGTVNINISGIAASAASIISMAADHLTMDRTAMMMIHNSSTSIDNANSQDLEKTKNMLDQTNKSIANAYVARSGLGQATALDLMAKETWLTVDDAINYGLVDEVAHNKEAMTVLNSGHSMPNPDRMAFLRDQTINKSSESATKDAVIEEIQESKLDLDVSDDVKDVSITSDNLTQKLKVLRGE